MSVEPGKWGVIYNPKQAHEGAETVERNKEYMDSKGSVIRLCAVRGFGSVERLAGILANNGYRTIVVVGGRRRCVNDAINGIMSSNAEKKKGMPSVSSPTE